MIKLLSLAAVYAASLFTPVNLLTKKQNDNKDFKIQIALLLDTSSSMDGLIEQAKSQLWKMVNELATSKKEGKVPDIELALYEYGKDDLPAADGYMKQIVPLTTDLDLVSEKLFALRTNGGSEYCGWTIDDAVEKLKWSKSNDDLKIIFIAGNEEFNQGKVDYKAACKKAITNGIIVNTIFCGECENGIRIHWKDGADRADGKYMCINQNDRVVHIETPYDTELAALSDSLNTTYIGYGKIAEERQMMQIAQDKNASGVSKSNAATRAASKASNAYNNDNWDVVDAMKKGKEMKDFDKEDLPEEMKNMNEAERKAYVDAKAAKRTEFQNKIKELNEKRETYIADERKKLSDKNTLDDAMINTIQEQAVKLKFSFE